MPEVPSVSAANAAIVLAYRFQPSSVALPSSDRASPKGAYFSVAIRTLVPAEMPCFSGFDSVTRVAAMVVTRNSAAKEWPPSLNPLCPAIRPSVLSSITLRVPASASATAVRSKNMDGQGIP